MQLASLMRKHRILIVVKHFRNLVDTISNTIISTIQQNLGTEKKVQVFSMDTFNNISNDNTVLTLKMSSDNNDSVKVLALEFNM